MGSSSKGGGNQWAGMAPVTGTPDAKMTKGPGFGKATNAYYSNKAAVPLAGGLVRPDSIPGLQQGIGLNAYKPPAVGLGGNFGSLGGDAGRAQLAGVISPPGGVNRMMSPGVIKGSPTAYVAHPSSRPRALADWERGMPQDPRKVSAPKQPVISDPFYKARNLPTAANPRPRPRKLADWELDTGASSSGMSGVWGYPRL